MVIDLPIYQILVGFLSFLRMGSMLLFFPFFGDQVTPVKFRVLFTIALCMALSPMIFASWDVSSFRFDLGIGALSFLILKEILLGSFIGLIGKISLEAVYAAAAHVSYQMGFGTAHVFMPFSGSNENSFTALHQIFILLVFVSLNQHFIFVKAIIDSFKNIPLGFDLLRMISSVSGLIDLTSGIFVTSLQLAAPVLVAIFLATAAIGLLSRAVPQLNVFVVNFQVNFYVGLLIYAATLPSVPGWFQEKMLNMDQFLLSMVRHLKGA